MTHKKGKIVLHVPPEEWDRLILSLAADERKQAWKTLSGGGMVELSLSPGEKIEVTRKADANVA